METAAILWRRLDAAGHDACRLVHEEDAWRLDGVAAFQQSTVAAALVYTIDCDDEWRTREGVVRGWIGTDVIDLRIVRTLDGSWTVDGQLVPGLQGCLDLDFGFTPATNISQLRRLALRVGEAADVTVAWLDVFRGSLEMLHQRYERRTTTTYWYEAPRFDYAALLLVSEVGFVESYPGLWIAER